MSTLRSRLENMPKQRRLMLSQDNRNDKHVLFNFDMEP